MSSELLAGVTAVVRPPEDDVDRVVAKLLGECLDTPRPRIAVILADPDVALDVELALAGEVAVVDHLVDRVVHVGELAVGELDPAQVLERDPPEVVGRDAELRHVPGVDCDASVAPRRSTDDLQDGVEGVHVRIGGHELVDDLRVGALGGDVAQLAEPLAEL